MYDYFIQVCGLCCKTKISEGSGHSCSYCNVKFCSRCGGRVPVVSSKVWDTCIYRENVFFEMPRQRFVSNAEIRVVLGVHENSWWGIDHAVLKKEGKIVKPSSSTFFHITCI